MKSHQVNFKILAGFGHLELLFWRISIWNHCGAEAATEATLDIADEEVYVWSSHNEITGYGYDAKPEKTREITSS